MKESLLSQLLRPRWAIIFVLSFLVIVGLVISVAVWSDLRLVWGLEVLSVAQKIVVSLGLLADPLNHMTVLTLGMALLAAALGALNVVLVGYVRSVRKEVQFERRMGENMVATVLIVLGTGCAACGSVVLLSMLSLFGVGVAAWLSYWLSIAVLVLAVLVLAYSNCKLYRQAQHPLVCEV